MPNGFSPWKKFQSDLLALWEEKWSGEPGSPLLQWQRCVRFAVFVIRSFVRNRCPVRASSLAYTTLLALIPVLAVGISISTSMLKTQKVEDQKKQIEGFVNAAIDKLAPQLGLTTEPGKESSRTQIVQAITHSINDVQSGALGATAAVTLILIAISLLSNIEATMNDIWGVTRGRTWLMRGIYYWAVITLGPLLLLFALGLGTGAKVAAIKQWLEQFPVILFIDQINLLPLLILIFSFSAFYFLMPNTKVEWRAALLGGFVAGGLLHLNNLFNSIYFGQVVRNSKFWGGLGAMPVFLIGLYFSWMILLFGAQMAYAFQNRRSYFQEKDAENLSQRGREFIALRVMALLGRCFAKGQRPPTAAAIAVSLGISHRLAARTLEPLLRKSLVMEVAKIAGEDEGIAVLTRESGYAPARPLTQISCQDVLQAMRGAGHELRTKEDAARTLVQAEYEKIQSAERAVAASVTLEMLALAEATGAQPTVLSR